MIIKSISDILLTGWGVRVGSGSVGCSFKKRVPGRTAFKKGTQPSRKGFVKGGKGSLRVPGHTIFKRVPFAQL